MPMPSKFEPSLLKYISKLINVLVWMKFLDHAIEGSFYRKQ